MQTLFQNRNFAGLFAGRLVTNIGDSLYFVAAMWLVWELTGNELYTGLAGFLVLAPSGLQFLFGPLVDRWDLRRVLVGTQLIQALLVLSVPVAAATDLLSVWLVLLVMPLLSLLNQFVYPAQSAAIPRLVEKDELVQANSLFALAYQGTEAVFNGLAGVLVALVGAVAIFTFDAVTFAVAAALFATLAVPRAEPVGQPSSVDDPVSSSPGVEPTPDGGVPIADAELEAETPAGALSSYRADLREGFAFLRGTFLVVMIGGSLVINFALGATIAVLPSYGATLAGPEGYGFLMAALALGTLAGALLASVVATRPFGHLAIAAFLLSGVTWLGAVSVGWLPATAALFVLAFVPVGITNVLIASLVQAVVPETLLGRVTAVLGSASAMATPFGALAGGFAAATLGPVPVMTLAGGGFLFLAAYTAAIPSLRRLPAVGEIETLSVDA